MRYVAASGFGGPEVLRVYERDLPAPARHQVTLEVEAAGVNPVEWRCYSGEYGQDRSRIPLRIGAEAAGVVRAVGADVHDVRPGDEVIAFRVAGAYADLLNVSAASVVPKPTAMTWPEAAGLMLAGTTAVHAARMIGIGPGDVVLVHGAAGGVGSLAVQLVREAGADVIGTAGTRNHEFVSSLGATPVEYGDGLHQRIESVLDGRRATAAIDTVGTEEALRTSVDLVGDPGRITTVAGFRLGPELGIRIVSGGSPEAADIRNAARQELVDLVARGRLTVHVSETFPLADAAGAHTRSRAGHVRGKLALIP